MNVLQKYKAVADEKATITQDLNAGFHQSSGCVFRTEASAKKKVRGKEEEQDQRQGKGEGADWKEDSNNGILEKTPGDPYENGQGGHREAQLQMIGNGKTAAQLVPGQPKGSDEKNGENKEEEISPPGISAAEPEGGDCGKNAAKGHIAAGILQQDYTTAGKKKFQTRKSVAVKASEAMIQHIAAADSKGNINKQTGIKVCAVLNGGGKKPGEEKEQKKTCP